MTNKNIEKGNPSETTDRELILTREFDAPLGVMFNAWSKAEHIGQWWVPEGFSTTTYEMDFRVGGVWRFMMHGPDGTDYPNIIIYEEIEKPARLVYLHGEDKDKPAHFHVTVEFKSLNDKTRLRMRMLFPSKEALEKTVESGAIEGGNQTLNRLAEFLRDNLSGVA